MTKRKPGAKRTGRPRGTGLPLAIRFWAKVSKADGDGCWTWMGFRGNGGLRSDGVGYGKIALQSPGDGTNARLGYAHRVSWLLHFGEIPDGKDVLHRCDNPPCVRPDHLFLGNAVVNGIDMAKKGRTGTAKLTEDQAREILSVPRGRAGYGRLTEMASRFGVTISAVGLVRSRRNWGWLDVQ